MKNYQSLSISIGLIVGTLLAGCATRHFERKTITTYPDGRTVIEEVKATDKSFCYDSTLEGFSWDSSPSNTSIRVDKHDSTGGETNVAVIAVAVGKGFDALKATAEVAK